MSAELVDPFAPAPEAMSEERYQDLWDKTRSAVLDDKTYLPEVYAYLFGRIGARAKTPGLDDDGWAAATLETIALRAESGIPMFEPQGEVL
jgi:hypothetical protein